MSVPTVNESSQQVDPDQLELALGSDALGPDALGPEIVSKGPGFLDPAVRERASARSLAVRRGEVPAEPKSFLPSKNMLIVLRIALDLESGNSVRGWFAKAGLNRGSWFDWQAKPEFRAWWKKAFAEGVKEYETTWLKIGLRKMSKDFRYWDSIGKRVLGFIDKISIKEEKSPEEAALYSELLDLIQSYKGIKKDGQQSCVVDVSSELIEEQLLNELQNEELSELKEGDH